jgi:3-phenylpropionate/cinnamic acid dioxygenase small subunit
MSVELTREQLMQMLYQQANMLFGRERAERLEPLLQEQASYLWQLWHHLPEPEDEPEVPSVWLSDEEG